MVDVEPLDLMTRVLLLEVYGDGGAKSQSLVGEFGQIRERWRPRGGNRNGDDSPRKGESSPSVVSNGSTLFADPLMVEPLNRHNPDGVFPRVSFLTDLSIAGRKAGLLTVTERPKVSFPELWTAPNFSRTGGSGSRLPLPHPSI